MTAPPEPETKSPVPAGELGHRAGSQSSPKSNTESDTSPLDFQAGRLSRIYSFCYATARTIAGLAFAGGPR
ncbi:hypothetical protein ABIF62_007704 [Bradyrhizobium japonicum]